MNMFKGLRTTLAELLMPAPELAATDSQPATTKPTTEPTTKPTSQRVAEAAGVQIDEDDEAGWTRLSASTGAGRDLTPMAQDRMQRLAEFLWQSNALANRLVEIPLAYLLAEGVRLECPASEDHQQLLDRFWNDPINNWPYKLAARVRSLALHGEQCYTVHVNEVDGFVRLGYLAPQNIGDVIMDPDNPEQPIGVVTKRDAKGRYKRYRVLVLGDDEQLFTARTAEIRAGFTDGQCFLFQVNKLPDGKRGRSDMLAAMDWLDGYDEFLFGELDRNTYLRSVVWDLKLTGGTPKQVEDRAKTFQPPRPNSVFVHNDSEELTAVTPDLQAADTSQSARLFRNHVLLSGTMPEHWAGGGGDVNRAAAGEMGEPTFKVYTQRQSLLKLMLEEIGRYVLMQQRDVTPDWSKPEWKVVARFPELASKDVTKFASAMREVTTAVLLLRDKGLLTDERALALVADVAQRFGAEIDPTAEIAAAKAEAQARAAQDVYAEPGEGDDPDGGQPSQQMSQPPGPARSEPAAA